MSAPTTTQDSARLGGGAGAVRDFIPDPCQQEVVRMTCIITEVRARPEGGGHFAPALGGGSGANRTAGGPGTGSKGLRHG